MKVILLLAAALLLGACTQRAGRVDHGSEAQLREQLASADLALREARLTDAEVLYRGLARSHPRLPEVWLQLGNIYARQAQLEAAMRSYKDGLQYNREDARLWHNLALIELRQAIHTLETASTVLPRDHPQLARLQQLHRSLLSAGQAGTDTAR